MASGEFNLILQLLMFAIYCNMASVAIPTHRPYCNTDGCKAAGHILKKSINSAVKPCDDFYEYACGKYINDHPKTQMPFDASKEIGKRLVELLKSTDPEKTKPEKMPTYIMELLQRMYFKCKNLTEADLQKRWAEEVKNVINRLGGMPLFTKEKYTCNATSFAKFLAQTHKLNILYYDMKGGSIGNPAIFTPLVETISFNRRETIMTFLVNRVYDVKTGYQPENVVNVVNDYANAIEVAPLPPQDPRIIAIKEFELLLNVTKTIKQTDMNYTDMAKILNNTIDLKTYMEEFLPESFKSYFSDHPPKLVRTYELNFFNTLAHALNDDVTPCEVKYNYVFFKMIEASRQTKTEAQGGACFTVLQTTPLAQALAALYLLKYQPDSSRLNDVGPMALQIRNAMKQLITSASWIKTPTTREKAIKKVGKVTMLTGGSQLFYDDVILKKFYDGLTIESHLNYYDMRRELGTWYVKRMMSRLGSSDPLCVNDIWYKKYALRINAFYQPQYNQVVMLPGFLHEPFYRRDFPQFFNFGSAGFLIGHEISHGFDNMGRKYNAGGDMENWWDDETNAIFTNKAQCFIQQYGSIEIQVDQTTYKIRGLNTLSENIADNGGIKVGFMAYKDWKKGQKQPERHLGGPGLESIHDITPDQLFFVSAALLHCGSQTNSSLRRTILIDVHSPAKYRINTAFGNYEEFHIAFGCKKDTKMNPNNQCKIW